LSLTINNKSDIQTVLVCLLGKLGYVFDLVRISRYARGEEEICNCLEQEFDCYEIKGWKRKMAKFKAKTNLFTLLLWIWLLMMITIVQYQPCEAAANSMTTTNSLPIRTVSSNSYINGDRFDELLLPFRRFVWNYRSGIYTCLVLVIILGPMLAIDNEHYHKFQKFHNLLFSSENMPWNDDIFPLKQTFNTIISVIRYTQFTLPSPTLSYIYEGTTIGLIIVHRLIGGVDPLFYFAFGVCSGVFYTLIYAYVDFPVEEFDALVTTSEEVFGQWAYFGPVQKRFAYFIELRDSAHDVMNVAEKRMWWGIPVGIIILGELGLVRYITKKLVQWYPPNRRQRSEQQNRPIIFSEDDDDDA
jgi:hypothetical protein